MDGASCPHHVRHEPSNPCCGQTGLSWVLERPVEIKEDHPVRASQWHSEPGQRQVEDEEALQGRQEGPSVPWEVVGLKGASWGRCPT